MALIFRGIVVVRMRRRIRMDGMFSFLFFSFLFFFFFFSFISYRVHYWVILIGVRRGADDE